MGINIRFGSGGDLLSLAQRSGEGQNFNTRFQQDQQLVQQAVARQNQQSAIRLEQQRLDVMAQTQRTAQSSTSRSRTRTPFTQSVTQANEEFKQVVPITQLNAQQASGGTGRIAAADETSQFSVDESGRFVGQELGIELTEDEIKERSGQFVTGTPQQQGTPLQLSKIGLLQNITGVVDADKQALLSLVNDETISLKDFAIRASGLRDTRGQGGITSAQRLRANERAIRDETDDIDKEQRRIEDEFDDANINLLGRTPADLLGVREFTDDPRLQALFRRRIQLQERKKELVQEQRSLTGLVQEQATPDAQPTEADSVSDISTEDLLRQLGI